MVHLSLPLTLPKERRGLHSQVIGWLALAVAIAGGSTFTSFGRKLLQTLSPLSVVFLGEVCIVFFILLSFGVLPMLKKCRRIKHSHIAPLLAIGILATVSLLMIYTGLEGTAAANAELFGRSEMAFLILLSSLLLKERVTRAHITALLITIGGIAIVALRGFEADLAMHSGDTLIIGGSLGFAIVNILFKKYLSTLPPELVLFFRSSTAIIIFFLASPFLEHAFIEEVRALPLGLLPALLGFGLIARFLTILTFYEAVERLPVSKISLFTPLNILGAIVFANIYLGEPILWYHILGGGLIVSGAVTIATDGIHGSEERAKAHMKQHHRHHL